MVSRLRRRRSARARALERLPSRVVADDAGLLDLLDRVRSPRDVLRSRLGRRAASRTGRGYRQAGHEVGSHGHLHQRVYELTPDGFAQDLDAARRAALAAAVSATSAASARPSGRSTSARSGRSTRSRAAAPRSTRAWRRCGSSATPTIRKPSALAPTSPGEIVEFPPAVDRRFGQNMPLGGAGACACRGRQPSSRDRGAHARRRVAILWPAPLGNRHDPPRVTLPRGTRFAHYFRLSGFRARLEQILTGTPIVPLSQLVRSAGLA